ncbi:MAG: hypothetical protein LBB63_00885 [Holosporaceae bacterium]|nr:hypothetical protein [Holosporaceae bacterium]
MPASNISLTHDKVYYTAVELAFRELSGQRGSYLFPLFPKVAVDGNMDCINSVDTQGASWMEAPAEPVVYNTTEFGKRYLKPNVFSAALLLDQYETARTRLDPSQVASMLWNKVGIFLDDIILYGKNGVNGFAGNALAQLKNDDPIGFTVPLPTSRIIPYNDVRYGYSTNIADPNDTIKYGLSSAKINNAFITIQEALKYEPRNLICVASSRANGSSRADERLGNVLWNDQKALATGMNLPYSGVRAFVTSECVKKGVESVVGDGTKVEYSYVVDPEQVAIGYLGRVPEMQIQFDQLPQRHHALQILVSGAYDCVRMSEDAVVAIEIRI